MTSMEKIKDYEIEFYEEPRISKEDLKELKLLTREYLKAKKTSEAFTPTQESRETLETDITETASEIISFLKKRDLKKLETDQYTFSLRKVPTYFEIESETKVINSLKRRGLNRFIRTYETIELADLKNYLLATETELPGTKKIDDAVSLYIFDKFPEEEKEETEKKAELVDFDDSELEMFLGEGIEEDLSSPQARSKQLWADLRYLGNSCYPKLKKGESWGDWTEEKVIETFARIIDTLRSIYFVIPEKSPESSSYWELYHKAKPYMQSSPPETKEEIEEWNQKRKEITAKPSSHSENPKLAGLYLVSPHAEMIHSGAKTKIIKSIRFQEHIDEDVYLISDEVCWGIIRLGVPQEITKKIFQAEYPSHLVEKFERTQWWNDKWPLFSYNVEIIQSFSPVKKCEIPPGVQVWIGPDNIHMKD